MIPLENHRTCFSRLRAFAALAGAAIALAACAAIPTSGPTGRQLRSQIDDTMPDLPLELVEVRSINELPAKTVRPLVFGEDYTPPLPTELVGPGDVLEIAVFETGISLFGGSAGQVAAASGSSAVSAASARSERFPPFRVNDDGLIKFPFVGDVYVAGKTTDQVETILRRSLLGKSQNPQVLVTIAQGLTNSVIIGGDIRSPGRIVLPTNRETISDVVALAGGSSGEIKDILVRIQRGANLGNFYLSDILANPDQDIRIFPSDRILLVRAPRSFSVLGAAGRNDQIMFPTANLSLVEAVALSGGTNPNAGDPRAVFVFRNITGPDGEDRPTVYHFNMMEASSYILAQRFAMTDKDVLYVGNAEANQPTKMVQIISQLFFPLVALDSVINKN